MEELFSVLALLFWIGFAIVKQTKKQKNESQKIPKQVFAEPQTFTSFDEIVGQLLKPIAKPVPEPVAETTLEEINAEMTEFNSQEVTEIDTSSLEELTLAEGQDYLETDFAADRVVDNIEITDNKRDRQESFTVSLRKAVIYEAILNRPYA